MGRLHDVQLEIDYVPMDENEVTIILTSEGCSITDSYSVNDNEKHVIWDGTITLCGGENEAEANARMVQMLHKELPGLGAITFRFRYVETEWDEEFVSENGSLCAVPIRFVFNIPEKMTSEQPELTVIATKKHEYLNVDENVVTIYHIDKGMWDVLITLEKVSDPKHPYDIYTDGIKRRGMIYEDIEWVELYI